MSDAPEANSYLWLASVLTRIRCMSTVIASKVAPAPATSISASAPSPFTRNVVAPRVSSRPLTPTAAESSVTSLVSAPSASASTIRAWPHACPTVAHTSMSGEADHAR